MVDTLSKAERSRLMSRVRGKDTEPELVVRSMLHKLGYRYRLHLSKLPGKPDLVFPGRKKVIFVNGCYWHRHTCRRGRSVPDSNREVWLSKFKANRARDRAVRRQLKSMGWSVLTVWQCELKDPESVIERCVEFLEVE
ncbi:MAG: very short patch repair endonuclease [Phycisphaeraceae bacterium]